MAALQEGIAEAERRGVIVGISVVDEGANLVGSIIMSGAIEPWLCEDSKGKAMSTVLFGGRPTGTMEERSNGPMLTWLNNHYGGRLSFLRGAVPIKRGGQLVGAAGAGGAPTDIDEAIAQVVADILGSD
jgi:uncharacterized protein GlcG (DUF336 family)